MIDIELAYKSKVIKVWQKYKDIKVLTADGCEYRKSPILTKSVYKNSILFVGMNPSFRKNSIIATEKKEIEFYPIISNTVNEIAYFKKFSEIANYCNEDKWAHLDLFFMRETNQKIIEELSISNKDFLQEQLNISFDIIEKASPKIIVVANSFASEFFGKMKAKHHKFSQIWRGYDLDFSSNNFNKDIGTYIINIANKETPIIFSGMLSGQRALDIGSYERLKWQIKMILNKASW